MNTLASKYFPELIASWDECNWMKGVNIISVEPWESKPIVQLNIKIMTRGGKRTSTNVETSETNYHKANVTKRSYDSNQPK